MRLPNYHQLHVKELSWKHRATIIVIITTAAYVAAHVFHIELLAKGYDGLIAVSVDKFIFGRGENK